MGFYYKIYGLNFYSEDLKFPQLIPYLNNNESFDIKISKEDSKKWPFLKSSENDTEFLKITGRDIRVFVDNIVQLRIYDGKYIAWEKLSAKSEDKDILPFIMSIGFGSILIQRNYLVLHGNALEKNGQAICCIGNSGVGKSTTAYALIKNGWNLLSDDLVLIDSNMNIKVGIPTIKLWSDVIEKLNVDKSYITKVRTNLKKYFVNYDYLRVAEKDTKLERIYKLNSALSNISDNKRIKKIDNQKDIFLYLRDNSFKPRIIRGTGFEGNNFLNLTRLQKSIPMYKLTPPDDLTKIVNWFNKVRLL